MSYQTIASVNYQLRGTILLSDYCQCELSVKRYHFIIRLLPV